MQKRLPKHILSHMRPGLSTWSWRRWICYELILAAGLFAQTARADPILNDQTTAEVTNVSQIRLLASQTPNASYSMHLEGDVWWASPLQEKFVLKDDSGAEELEMDFHGQ